MIEVGVAASAAMLILASLGKLAHFSKFRSELLLLQLRSFKARTAVAATVLLLEAGCAIALIVQPDTSAVGAALVVLAVSFALYLGVMVKSGNRSCSCFGRESRIGLFAALRLVVLAATALGLILQKDSIGSLSASGTLLGFGIAVVLVIAGPAKTGG